MDDRVPEIRKHLKKKLDPMRFEHTLGVAYTCQCLAMRYGFDLDRAELTGLLHDCAKRYDEASMLKKCLEREIPVSDAEVTDPSLLHAKLGGWMAEEKYGIHDKEIREAIECHTTGRCGMTLLDKILYLADYIEPRRWKAADLAEIRKLAFVDLDEACLAVMESTLSYLKSRNCPIDKKTIMACEDMRRTVTQNRQCRKESTEKKEGQTFETVKRNGENRRGSVVRKKGRRYQNYRH